MHDVSVRRLCCAMVMMAAFSCLSVFLILSNTFNGSVDHKNTNIDGYLNEISEEQEEKTQLLEHIIEKKMVSMWILEQAETPLHTC